MLFLDPLKKTSKTLLLFLYFIAVLVGTQDLDLSDFHRDSQIAQEIISTSHNYKVSLELDLTHKQNTHSSSSDCNDCCVTGCNHHPAMIASVLSAYIEERSLLGLYSVYFYYSHDLVSIERPPIS